MNKILLDENIVNNINSDITIKEDILVINNNTDLRIDVNKNSKIKIDILDNNQLNLFILVINSKIELEINELKNSKCNISVFGINVNGFINVSLNEENSEVELNNSNFNNLDSKLDINILHNNSKTISHVYNNGCNYNNGVLEYDVNGTVIKSSSNCICNQDSKIINLTDNKCAIHPNLLIDNYDVVANHSAYIGSFKEDILFYLESRGIPKKECYELLLKAYLIGNMKIDKETEDELIMLITKYGGELFE